MITEQEANLVTARHKYKAVACPAGFFLFPHRSDKVAHSMVRHDATSVVYVTAAHDVTEDLVKFIIGRGIA